MKCHSKAPAKVKYASFDIGPHKCEKYVRIDNINEQA